MGWAAHAGRGGSGARRVYGAAPRQDGGQGGGAEGVRGRDRRRGGASAVLPGVRRLGPPGSAAASPLASALLGPGPLRGLGGVAGLEAAAGEEEAPGRELGPRRAVGSGLSWGRGCEGWLGSRPVSVLSLIWTWLISNQGRGTGGFGDFLGFCRFSVGLHEVVSAAVFVPPSVKPRHPENGGDRPSRRPVPSPSNNLPVVN